VLAGVTVDVQLSIWIDGAAATRLTGPMLWTHVGVSGPAAMNASRHWARARLEGRDVRLTVSFCPGKSFDTVERLWTEYAADRPKTSVQSVLSESMPASVASLLLDRIGIDPRRTLAHLAREDRRRLAHALVEWPLPVIGTRGYNYAEATAGGVRLSEIDPRTMESRVCSGLFLVGEVLDVDGRIGGFNFQWAWSSAHVAARAIAARTSD
jgi:predicted Rossmann fold flavoprotein